MLGWIGVALLSVSWLVGLGYYHLAEPAAWAAFLTGGTLLLTAWRLRLPSMKAAAIGGLLTLAGFAMIAPLTLGPRSYGDSFFAWLQTAPWPYWTPLLLVALGCLLRLVLGLTGNGPDESTELSVRQRRESLVATLLARLSGAAMLAGCVLLVQAVVLEGYAALTSRSHDLPQPLAALVGLVAQGLGVESSVYGSTVSLASLRTMHKLGATWELLLDPATLCFVAGGVAAIVVRAATSAVSVRRYGRAVGFLVLLVLLWLPVRAGLLIGLYLHDVLTTPYEEPILAMRVFWSTGIHLALLTMPVLVAWRLTPHDDADTRVGTTAGHTEPWRLASAAGLIGLGVCVLGTAIFWEPIGTRQAGRVVIDEYHPPGDRQWERTDIPFDTTWYGNESGYNYWCIYDYFRRFYSVERHVHPLNDEVLDNCDVLICKIPTRPYSMQEIDAVKRFVRRGGGLLVIGEHTNVFKSGVYLNSLTKHFGFTFRDDCLFGLDQVFVQRYTPPMVPHPTVRYVPYLEFATSCSIEPGGTTGRAAIRGLGLKNKAADYHAFNYYPSPSDAADMRYGAFAQLWTMRYGEGRIAAFTDSTIFSNFSIFEPGKKELWMGMVEWLNHRGPPVNPRHPLLVLGLPLLLGGVWLVRRTPSNWPVLVGAGILGWSVSVAGVSAMQAVAMPYPAPQQPLVTVAVDEAISRPELPRNGFINGLEKPLGFGVFERWVLRLGYFTNRTNGLDAFDSDLVVFARPSEEVTPQFRSALVKYVAEGGRVLVIDTPAEGDPADSRTKRPAGGWTNPKDIQRRGKPSTANALLEPFGLKIEHETSLSGELVSSQGWPVVQGRYTAEVTGGEPFAWVQDRPVGATAKYGNKGGSVTAVGFGWRLSDERMGGSGDVEPDKIFEELVPGSESPNNRYDFRAVYAWQFGLVRSLIERKPLGGSPVRPKEPPPGSPAAIQEGQSPAPSPATK